MTVWMLCLVSLAADPARVPLTADAELVFAGVEQGKKVLSAHDIYAASMGPLERQIRLASEKPVSTDALLAHAADQVLAWDEDHVKRLSAAVAVIKEKLLPFDLPLPPEVLLVRTSGKEESGAAYTRANAIVLSDRRLKSRGAGLERLLLHELFHVLSRHSPKTRQQLYAVIEFQPCRAVALPDDLQAIRLTNPDAPTLDYYITVEHGDEQLPVVPLLLSKYPKFNPAVTSLFGYLDFKLMAIENKGDAWQPLLRDGRPILIDGRTNKSYRKQIGENTGYIIHPDEILADNFVHLVTGKKDLPSPEVVNGMKKVLARASNRENAE